MAVKINVKNPNVHQPLIIIAAALVGIAIWYYTVYTEKDCIRAKLKSELAGKQKDLNNILALKPQLNRLEEEIAVAQHKLDSLKSIFPDQKEVPKMIREITGIARASGVFATKFNPRPDVEREYYIENRYDLSVLGGYHELARFFSFLANMPLIINLSNVSIKTNPGVEESKKNSEEHGSPINTITASFTMTTFSSKK
jgi:type IV pilus assembly protein PilO